MAKKKKKKKNNPNVRTEERKKQGTSNAFRIGALVICAVIVISLVVTYAL